MPHQFEPDYVPETEDDLARACESPTWRIHSGQLYKIMVKGTGDQEVTAIPFIPNAAQKRLMERLTNRNVNLKARQLGSTTCIAIMWLDHALFNADQRCGIIAHSLDDAAAIFRDKVKFAYDNLPPFIRLRAPLKRESQKELLFAHNNSAIRVATSMRSGTIHRLLVSEMGKIAAKHPDKSREIITGSLPAVPLTGMAVIESTAEGNEGDFYEIASAAQRQFEAGKVATGKEWRFHFLPWFIADEYRVENPENVAISPEEHLYFHEIEAYWAKTGWKVKISPEQRAWYVATRDHEFSGDPWLMYQEYPSTPDECWMRSTEGTFLTAQLARARQEGRIGRVPYVEGIPVNTFWDIGSGDGTAIWLHQYVAGQNRMIGFIEGWDKGYAHYVKALRETGYLFGGMYLPHDAAHVRQLADTVGSPITMLQEIAPDLNWLVVPRVETFQHGVDMLRQAFSTYWFDEEACKEGLNHLQEWRKKWNSRLQVWSDEPDKDNPHTEAADALRQHAQGFSPDHVQMRTRPRRRVRGGMVV